MRKTKGQNLLQKLPGIRPFLALVLSLVLALTVSLAGCASESSTGSGTASETSSETSPYSTDTSSTDAAPEMPGADALDLSQIPPYSDAASIVIGDNTPDFSDTEKELAAVSTFIDLSDLDNLGRCGPAFASLSIETLSYEARESIAEIHPTAWQHSDYDFVDGESLYNRCHLLGHALSGLNAEAKNLITGTRYLNTDGMLEYEEAVHDYIERTGNHVLYRVTPIFSGDNLLASGVRMEGWSVEDAGGSICFDVYCYNVQPGVEINYATGDNWAAGTDVNEVRSYVLNTRSMKFHLPDCDGVADISAQNRKDYEGSRQSLIDKGYTPCGSCQP